VIELAAHAEGVILPVKAEPGSRHQGIRGEHAGALKVAVRQAAEKGKANQALIETLAAELGLKKQQIELLSGATGGRKRFLLRGVHQAALQTQLERLLSELDDRR
jgi:uncharacterized protein YggU (UPF0235/DUF167 family)